MSHSATVVLLAATLPDPETVTAAVARERADDREVRLAGLFDLSRLPADLGLTETRALGVGAESQGPSFRRGLRGASAVERLRLHVQTDPWMRRRLAAGDRLVGLDRTAREVAEVLTAAPPTLDRGVRALTVRSGGPRPLLAETARGLAIRAVGATASGRRSPVAGRLIDLGARFSVTPRHRADLLGDFTAAERGAGVAASRLKATVAAELTVADAALARGDLDTAAEAYHEATEVLYHRAVQFDRLDSPLPADPAAFVAPLLDSSTARRIAAPRGRVSPPRVGRPRSILLATWANPSFIGPIAARLRHHAPDVELRQLDLAGQPELRKHTGDRIALVRLLLDPSPATVATLERSLRPHLDRADVVFVDWCTALAVLVTAIDPGTCRIIVRLHSFEAFSWWPQLVDFSRVDDVVFVSTHLRDLAMQAIPGLQASTTRRHVVPIGIDSASFRRPKRAEARFTLGLVGYGQIAKDPRWALDVLTRLRADDERYRLLLIGSDLQVSASAAARDYTDRFHRELAALESVGAARRYGPTDDVPAALTEVGVILSSSVRESYHLGLIEGAASGAVPVVRDWPLFATRPTGARSLYPDPWIVATAAGAAERIRSVTGTEQRWREHGETTAALVADRFDAHRTDPLVDALFFGDPPVEQSPEPPAPGVGRPR